MNPLTLRLPAGAVVKGRLLPRYELADLDQNIMEIDLPGGLTVDVGWHPEFDATGSFRVVVYRDYWSDQIREPIFAKTPQETAEVVERVAAEHSQAAATRVG